MSFNPTIPAPQLNDSERDLLMRIALYFHNARTGAVPLKVAIEGGGGGETGPLLGYANHAWVNPDNGSDLTGAAGDPNKPFATTQAAFLAAKTAGANPAAALHLSPGTHTALNFNGLGYTSVTLMLAAGAGTALINSITWNLAAGETGALQLHDLGGRAVTIGLLDGAGASGANGEDATDPGGAGGKGVDLYGSNIRFGDANVSGGAGGNAGPELPENGAVLGGDGGNGGLVDLSNCEITSALYSNGGAGGGAAGADANGGAGGIGGTVTVRRSDFGGVLEAKGGPGGASTGTGSSAGGQPGEITGTNCTVVGTVSNAGYSSGGLLNLRFCRIGNFYNPNNGQLEYVFVADTTQAYDYQTLPIA